MIPTKNTTNSHEEIFTILETFKKLLKEKRSEFIETQNVEGIYLDDILEGLPEEFLNEETTLSIIVDDNWIDDRDIFNYRGSFLINKDTDYLSIFAWADLKNDKIETMAVHKLHNQPDLKLWTFYRK